jgi:hypothetical protein
MASYNPSNQTDFQYNQTNIQNKGLFSRMLRNIQNWGQNYDDMVIRNQYSVGINEDPMMINSGLYDLFSQRSVANVLGKKSIPYLDKGYADKKRILREYSVKDEIRDFVSTISDESIVYDDSGKDFCHPSPLSSDYPQDVVDKYQEYFEKIYNKYGFSDSISAWNLMRDFLIDGFVCMEIVYDDKSKEIIGFVRMKPETVVPAFEPSIGSIWIQYPEDPQNRRIFLDSQIIYISYSIQNDYTEISYVEGLIKPYNQLKILEQTRIMYNIVNAMVYQKFTIPTKGLSRQRAEEQIGQLIHDYSEEVEWDDTLGTVTLNGSKHLPLNKQIWFPDGDAGTPNMELVAPQGANLNENDMLTWFYNILKRASKMPFSRFERENGGGNVFSDAAEMTRDEVKFSNFINRLRTNFKELMVKPLKIQMLLEFPELKEDEVFINQVDILFNSNQLFEEWKKISNLQKRADALTSLTQIMNGEQPYFHIEYLMDHVFKLTPEEKEENAKYWLKEKMNDGQGGNGGDINANGDGGGDFGGDTGAQSPSPNMDSGMEGSSGGIGNEPPTDNPDTGAGGGDTGSEFEF